MKRTEKILSPEEARTLIDKNMSEKDFLALIREYARAMDWTIYHTLRSKGSDLGFPDLVMIRSLAVKNGHVARLIFAELKREGQPLTYPQREWIGLLEDMMHDCNHGCFRSVEVYIWKPSDWGKILKILAR